MASNFSTATDHSRDRITFQILIIANLLNLNIFLQSRCALMIKMVAKYECQIHNLVFFWGHPVMYESQSTIGHCFHLYAERSGTS